MAGRPKVYATEAERVAANQAARARSKLKVKNITLDADLVDVLNDTSDRLEAEFGFRPTLSQTVRHLLKKKDADQ